jgi:DUF4097 and DUF4098 domain-containing protein YvlB
MTRTVFLPLLVGAFLAAALPADAQRRRDRDREDRIARLDTSLSLARGGIVELEGTDGEFLVTGWDRDDVQIRATIEDGDLRLDATSSRIQLKSLGMGGSDVRYEVSVPAGTRVLLTGRSVDMSVRGTRGDVEAHTQNGDIAITDAASIEVDALNGDVELRTVDRVRVNLVSGDVRIDGGRGPVEANTVSGNVDLHRMTARSVTANTTSGDVFFEGQIDASGRYDFMSHSSNVVVRLPADVSAAVMLQTYSGEIESDFPIVLESGATMGGHPRRFDFRIGNGGARITMTSFSGAVRLERAGNPNRQED